MKSEILRYHSTISDALPPFSALTTARSLFAVGIEPPGLLVPKNGSLNDKKHQQRVVIGPIIDHNRH